MVSRMFAGMGLFFLVLDALHALAWATGAQPAVHEWIEIAIHHALHITRFHAGAQVFDHAIRLKDVTANLVAPRDRSFVPVEAFHFRFLLIDALRVDARDEELHCGGAILMLRALALAGHHKA